MPRYRKPLAVFVAARTHHDRNGNPYSRCSVAVVYPDKSKTEFVTAMEYCPASDCANQAFYALAHRDLIRGMKGDPGRYEHARIYFERVGIAYVYEHASVKSASDL